MNQDLLDFANSLFPEPARSSDSVSQFVAEAGPLAERVGQRLGVDPAVLLGQWGLETGWGKSVIPGTNNYGNIKDFSGSGVSATDNMTGSRDKYRAYQSPDEFGDDFAGLIERRYQGATNAGGDALRFASALKAGGYAEDPDYVNKLVSAADMVRGTAQPVSSVNPDWQRRVQANRQAASDAAPFSTSFKRGMASMQDSLANVPDVVAGDEQSIVQRLEEARQRDLEMPMPTSAQGFLDYWKDGNYAAALLNPMGMAAAMTEQLPNSIPSMVGSVPGMVAGGVAGSSLGPMGTLLGSAIGGFIGSAPGSVALEMGARITEMAARDGVDLANPQAMAGWLSENRDMILEEGFAKGLTVAGMDGIAGGIGMRIVAGPALKLRNAESQVLARLGATDDAAIKAAQASAPYKAAMAPALEEFKAATTVAQNAMRGAASFVSETVGEGAGEYYGEVAARGEGDLNEALLEAVMAGGQSAITTGAQALGSRMLKRPENIPNSPLTNAANAGQNVQDEQPVEPAEPTEPELSPFDQRLEAAQSMVEDKAFIQAVRGTEGLGPESVTEVLSAFAKARNPNLDERIRDRALTDLEGFIQTFANRPNFVLRQDEEGGQIVPTDPTISAQGQIPTQLPNAPIDGEVITRELPAPDEYRDAFKSLALDFNQAPAEVNSRPQILTTQQIRDAIFQGERLDGRSITINGIQRTLQGPQLAAARKAEKDAKTRSPDALSSVPGIAKFSAPPDASTQDSGVQDEAQAVGADENTQPGVPVDSAGLVAGPNNDNVVNETPDSTAALPEAVPAAAQAPDQQAPTAQAPPSMEGAREGVQADTQAGVRAYSKQQADRYASILTNQGLPSEVTTHPTEPGKFAVVPAGTVLPSPTVQPTEGDSNVQEEGRREALLDEPAAIKSDLDAAAHEAATSPLNDRKEPTDKQKEAGNFKVGRVRIFGMEVSIENPKGSIRSGIDKDGNRWERVMQAHYGYFVGTKARDGDNLDVYLGDDAENAKTVFVIDQIKADGTFDEHKTVVGPDSEEAARALYLAHYPDDWTGLGAITSMPVEAFKAWALDGKKKRKPLAYVAPQDNAPAAVETTLPAQNSASVDALDATQESAQASEDQAAVKESLTPESVATGFEQLKASLKILGDPDTLKQWAKDRGIAVIPRKDGVVVPNRKQWDAARKQIPMTVEERRVEGVPDRLADVTLETYEDGSVKLIGPSEITSGESADAVLARYAKNYATEAEDATVESIDDVAERIADDAAAAHVEDGEAQQATPAVVAGSVQKSADETPLGLKAAKAYLLSEIDKAIKSAPSERPSKEKMDAADRFVTFDVPGDGKFKVLNTVERLKKFRSTVNASPGFSKPRQATKAPSRFNPEVSQSRYSVTEMLDDGDLISAYEYAKSLNKPLLFGRTQAAPLVYLDAGVADIPDVDAMVGQAWKVVGKQDNGRKWHVIDLKTGQSIASGEDKASAVRKARDVLEDPENRDRLHKILKETQEKEPYSQEQLADDWLKWAEEEQARIYQRKQEEYDGKQPESEKTADEDRNQPDTVEQPADTVDYKGFERTPLGSGAFELSDGNMTVRVEPTTAGKFQAAFRSAKSTPHLVGEQGAVDWADAYRGESERAQEKARADVSSVAGQKALAERGSRIASLKAMNAQLREIDPAEAWADSNIEDAKDLDALQDSISQSLVSAQRRGEKKQDDELRKRLENSSSDELKAVFGAMSLAGSRMSHAERVEALLQEDQEAVVSALDDVEVDGRPTGAEQPSSQSAQGIESDISADKKQPASVVKESLTTESDTITPDAAVKQMEWRDGGQRDGERRHTLFFKESEGDKNGFSVATLRKFGKGKWQLDDADLTGEIETYDGLREAKKAGQARALKYLEREGYVSAESASASTKIEDVGEKIGGARKDVWKAYSDKLGDVPDSDISEQPFSKIWPEPGYESLIDAGADPFVVSLIRAMRDAIPTKPRKGWKLKGWSSTVQALRDVARQLLDDKVSETDARKRIGEVSSHNRGLQSIMGQVELYQIVGHAKSLAGVSIDRHNFTVYKGEHFESGKQLWMISRERKATAMSNWPEEIAVGDTKAEAIEKFKEAYKTLGDPVQAKPSNSFVIFSQEKGYFVGKKIGRNLPALAGPFKTVADARQYRDDNADALESALAKFKEIPSVRRDTNEPRVGDDMRGGADVTAEAFAEAFGFRGVEFGNWVEQNKRQQDLNDAYDALMDMAAILGIPPKAISLNGELGLAFGARGTGGVDPAKAHYEPGFVVINLTKKEGAGSLGHEWWHALDNYFSRSRGKKSDMMTEALDVSLADRGSPFVANTAVRKAMVESFGTVMRAIRESGLKQRSSKLDAKRSKDYWTSKLEMSARAFEAYLVSKLQDQNASNDYLVNIVDEKVWAASEALGLELEGSYPYPTQPEVPSIRAAFDQFFQTIQHRETDKGVELYSRAIDNTNFRTKVFTALAQFDEFFEQPTPSSKSLKDIAHEIDAGFRVEAKNKLFAQNKTKGKAVKAWEIYPRGQDVRSAYVFEDARGRVWLDVARFKPGVDQGTKVYGIVAGYAHNNGKVFIGDPAGLSESGFHRRLENMISSALKYGTTDHLYPHAAQTDPAGYFQDQPEVAKRLKGLGIDWKEGDFAHNLTAMLEASYNATVRHTPAVKNIIYDFDSRQFVDAESGARRSRGDLASLPRGDAGGTPDSSRGGSRTYARAAIYNALVRGRSQEARRNILAQLGDQLQGRGLDVELGRVAYNVADPSRRRFILSAAAALAADPKVAVAQVESSPDLTDRLSPEIEAVLRDGSVSDALNAIAKSGPESLRSLAKKIADLVPSGIKASINDTAQVAYHGKVTIKDGIKLELFTAGDLTGLTYETFLHESLHAGIASRYVTLQNEARRQSAGVGSSFKAATAIANLRKMWQEYRKIAGRMSPDAAAGTRIAVGESYDSMDEFFVRALTDPEFQNFLAEIQYKDTTLLGRFFDWIKRMLGLKTERSWLDEALKASDDVLVSAKDDAPVVGGETVLYSRAIADAISNIGTTEGRVGIMDRVADYFSTSRTFNWWQRTVGSQYGKAKRDPEHFGRVFEHAKEFIADVSRFANRAAEKARSILPHMDTWGDIVNNANIRRQWEQAKGYQELASALFTGTLEAKTYTDYELESQFGLEDKLRKMYREFRAAVDASLDDLASSELARAARAAKLQIADQEMSLDEALDFYTGQLDPGIDAAREAIEDIKLRHEQENEALDSLEIDETYDIVAVNEAKKIRDQRQKAEIAEAEKAVEDLIAFRDTFTDKAEKIRKLQDQGYAPLMRFGQYTVDVVRMEDGEVVMNDDGEPDRPFFGMFESEQEAKEYAKLAEEEYPGYTVSQGILSTKSAEMYRGLTPETAEMFARMLGTTEEDAFQAYLKQAINNRSAMKRLIKRKGMDGFSKDVPRVLAAFVTSNARLASGNWHFGDMAQAINDIPQSKGDVKDEAIKLAQYIQNPQEEAAGLRGFMFFTFLGGSVASAMVNMTQTFSTTLPYISQFAGMKTPKIISDAMRDAGKVMFRKDGLDNIEDAELKEALHRASNEGVVDPQEIHLLMAESGSTGNIPGRIGEGIEKVAKKRFNKDLILRTPAERAGRAFTQAWGSLFGFAEKYNRHVAFIAAWNAAPPGVDRYQFAVDAVDETQFRYTKESRPNWGRGAVGATLFCVDDTTEALTQRGWLGPDDLKPGDMLASFDMDAGKLKWAPMKSVHVFDHDGEMVHATSKTLDMLMTPDHRVVHYRRVRKPGGPRGETIWRLGVDEAQNIPTTSRVQIPTSAEFDHEPTGEPIDDAIAPLVGWIATEGYFMKEGGIRIYQNEGDDAEQIRRDLKAAGFTWREFEHTYEGGNAPHKCFFIKKSASTLLRSLMPGKHVTPELIMRMTKAQIEQMVDRMIRGDGSVQPNGYRSFIQNEGVTLESFQMALTILGKSYSVRAHGGGNTKAVLIREPRKNAVGRYSISKSERVHYRGRVWCPIVPGTSTWVARRNGMPFITHNTFKTFIINYLEFLSRLPRKQQGLALGVLVMLSGTAGLPGSDDLDDVIDAVGQKLGYNWNNKAGRHAWLVKTFGNDATNFIERGISAALPLDVSARLSAGNLIPGTGAFKQSNNNRARDAEEFFGPAGSLLSGAFDVWDRLGGGKGLSETIRPIAPKAYNDLMKAIDIWETGYYRDSRGRKVVEADAIDGFVKVLGFHPNSVAEPRRVEFMLAQSNAMVRGVRSDIHELLARGQFEGDKEKTRLANEMLLEWNRKNPESKITRNPASVAARVRAMRSSSAERLVKATPRDLRNAVRAGMAVE